MFRRLKAAIFFRNLLTAVITGSLIGLLTGALWPSKKGSAADIVLGIIGAFFASLFLSLLGGGSRIIPSLIIQTLGSLLFILLGRLF